MCYMLKGISSCTVAMTKWDVQTLLFVSSRMSSYLFTQLDASVLFHLLMDSHSFVCGLYKSPFLQSQVSPLTNPLASWILPLPSKKYSCRLHDNTVGGLKCMVTCLDYVVTRLDCMVTCLGSIGMQ